jgi:hypothetical protein
VKKEALEDATGEKARQLRDSKARQLQSTDQAELRAAN